MDPNLLLEAKRQEVEIIEKMQNSIRDKENEMKTLKKEIKKKETELSEKIKTIKTQKELLAEKSREISELKDTILKLEGIIEHMNGVTKEYENYKKESNKEDHEKLDKGHHHHHSKPCAHSSPLKDRVRINI